MTLIMLNENLITSAKLVKSRMTFFCSAMQKLTGDNVMAVESDPIEIHKDDPMTINIDSPYNNLDQSKPKSTSGNSSFDDKHINLKSLSNGNLKSPMSPILEIVTPENDSIPSTVLESDAAMVTNSSAPIIYKVIKQIKSPRRN